MRCTQMITEHRPSCTVPVASLLLLLSACVSAPETSRSAAPETPAPVVSSAGVGGVTRATAFDREAIAAALPGFEVRETTSSTQGAPPRAFEATRNGRLALTVFENGPGTVGRVVVTDPGIPTINNVRVGTTLSNAYGNTGMPDCVPGIEDAAGRVLCPAPGLAGVRLVFSGTWDGPDGQLPPGDVLTNWTVESIVWNLT